MQIYYGIKSCNCKEMEQLFKKSEKQFKNLKNLDEKYIPVICFDEINMININNFLKLINYELESEGNKNYSFIGLSNSNLDNSMNQGIILSIPDMEEKDTQETALTIGMSYDEDLAKLYQKFFENLGITYYKYKKFLKDEHTNDGKDKFHGNRDFYHLIKNAAIGLLRQVKRNIDPYTLAQIAIESIEKNFGGLRFNDIEKTTSLKIIKEILSYRYPKFQVSGDYDIIKRIRENIND